MHDPGKIVADLAAAVALGGDCLAGLAVLREQPGLAGPVASDPVVSRLVAALAADGPRALKAIRAARVPSQMCVNPRKLNVSGFPSPLAFLRRAACGPNSISRVLPGCSSRLNLANRSRRSSRNCLASSSYWNPVMKSSANRTMTTSPRACVLRHHSATSRRRDRPRSGGGHEARHRQLDEARASFGERRHQPVSQVAEGDMVVTTVEVTLKHTGPFAGIVPTGKEVHSCQVFIHRLEDGKITDIWSYGDLLGVLRQLGATLSLP